MDKNIKKFKIPNPDGGHFIVDISELVEFRSRIISNPDPVISLPKSFNLSKELVIQNGVTQQTVAAINLPNKLTQIIGQVYDAGTSSTIFNISNMNNVKLELSSWLHPIGFGKNGAEIPFNCSLTLGFGDGSWVSYILILNGVRTEGQIKITEPGVVTSIVKLLGTHNIADIADLLTDSSYTIDLSIDQATKVISVVVKLNNPIAPTAPTTVKVNSHISINQF